MKRISAGKSSPGEAFAPPHRHAGTTRARRSRAPSTAARGFTATP